MRSLGILVALVALVALGAMMLGRDAGPTQASTPPQVSLDAFTTGTNACSVLNEAKCTLNDTDDFDVVITIAGAGNYGNWSLDLNHGSLDHGTVSNVSCAGTVKTTNGETIDCSNLSQPANSSTKLATVSFTCTSGTHTITAKDPTGDLSTAVGDSIEINCGESANMTLERKDAEEPFIKNTVKVSVKIGGLKLKDADGDGKAGYNGWQATVNWNATELTLGNVNFDTDLSTHLQNQGSGTILLGGSIGTGQNESVLADNVVTLSFTVLEAAANAGTSIITLKDGEVITEKGAVLSGFTDTVDIKAKAALVSLSFKGSGCKTLDGNTCRVEANGKVTISVDYSEVGVAPETTRARVRYGQVAGLSFQAVTFPNDPPCDPDETSNTAAPTVTINIACDADEATQADVANVFDLVLVCNDEGSGEQAHVVQLLSAGSGTTVFTTNSGNLPVKLGKNLEVICVGSTSDTGDTDGCDVDQEAAMESATGVSMDPNRFDLADMISGTGSDDKVLTQDIVEMTQAFGQTRTGPGSGGTAGPGLGDLAPDVLDADNIIDDGDITRAQDQFGDLSCTI